MSWALSDHMSTSVQLMVWCHEGTSHCLNQCSQRIVSSYDVTGSQWYKIERSYLIWTSFREKAWTIPITLHWRHNGRDGASNLQPHHCLINRLFRCRSKKTSKRRVTGLCAGNSTGTGELPAQMASNAENVSIWWRLPSGPNFACKPWAMIQWFGEVFGNSGYNSDVIMSAMVSGITSTSLVC